MKMPNLYQKLDDALMCGANQLVHAWNWTTGRTKADLASLCVLTGYSLSISDAQKKEKTGIIPAVLLALPLLALLHRYFKFSEQREMNASEKETTDPLVKMTKEKYKCAGTVMLTLGGIMDASPSSSPQFSYAHGLSCYIMRAENPPRRKDVVRRTVDKLKETFSRKPAIALVPTMYALEERL